MIEKKLIAFVIIMLFISVSVIPSTGNIASFDDTTPPVTTHSLNPPEPDGDNGYYVSDVTVTLNATDNESGVDRIEYRIDGGSWYTIQGGNGTFIIDIDGNDMLIEYKAVDNAGNREVTKSFTLDMDQRPPVADDIAWEAYKEDGIWYIDLTAYAVDATSGMDRVECYIEDELYVTIIGYGPDYVFTIKWSDEFPYKKYNFYHYDRAGNVILVNFSPGPPPPPIPMLLGIICNREIYEKTTSFFAIMVFNLNYLKLIICKHITVPNNYRGYIGKYFICATYTDYDWW